MALSASVIFRTSDIFSVEAAASSIQASHKITSAGRFHAFHWEIGLRVLKLQNLGDKINFLQQNLPNLNRTGVEVLYRVGMKSNLWKIRICK